MFSLRNILLINFFKTKYFLIFLKRNIFNFLYYFQLDIFFIIQTYFVKKNCFSEDFVCILNTLTFSHSSKTRTFVTFIKMYNFSFLFSYFCIWKYICYCRKNFYFSFDSFLLCHLILKYLLSFISVVSHPAIICFFVCYE